MKRSIGKRPDRRSIELYESLGYTWWLCECANSFVRRDLYGFIDVLAIKNGERPVGIQATSRSNTSARIKKIKAHEHYQIVKESLCDVVVHGWDSKKPGLNGLREEWL